MNSPQKIILGVSFSCGSQQEAFEKVEEAFTKQQQLFVVTPNPEICLKAEHSRSYSKTLNSSGLSLPDGFGILWASRYLSGKPSFFRWIWTLVTPWRNAHESAFQERVTGTDFVRRYVEQFPERRVFLLGASESVNKRLSQQLKEQGVNVVGNYSGNPSKNMEPIIRSMIVASEAETLFVAFGAPQQEVWISKNLPHLPSVMVAAGIGGAFDFLAGERKRAPKWMRSVGLEWLFRLIIEPRRLKRILNATVVFPWRVFISSKTSYN